MSACDHHRLDDPAGLCCVRPAEEHDPGAVGGHVYWSGTGSDVPDRHERTEAAAESRRG